MMRAANETVLAWATTIVWSIFYPIGLVLWYLAVSVLVVLRLLYRPLAFLLQPVVYLSRFVLVCLVAPFKAAAKFETIYIFLGVAAIVGLLGGLFMRSIYAALRNLLRLDAPPRPMPKPKGRTIKQYRAEKQEQKKEEPPFLLSPRHLSPGAPGYASVSDSGRSRGRQPRSLLAQTILEEDDSDY